MKRRLSAVLATCLLPVFFSAAEPEAVEPAPSTATVAAATAGTSTNPPATGPVYVIPVDNMIERGLLYVVRRGLDQAERDHAAAVVLHMNTPGGSVAVTEEIIRLLMALPRETRTFTFVDTDALSAGALISLTTGTIYMAPGSRIGASAIVTPFGDIQEGDMKEKLVSSLVALVSAAAQRQGHDPALVEAMIRRSAGYTIGGEEICPKGELLTLTDLEAARVVNDGTRERPILSAGTVSTLEDMLRREALDAAPRIELSVTWSEHAARWIETFGVLFLIGGILGLYIEFKLPGFGLPGVIGIVCLAIFFWGHHVAGLAGAEEVLIFLLGATLLAVEIFLIPGFGVVGITGLALMVMALVLAMLHHVPGGPLLPPVTDVAHAVGSVSAALIAAFVLGLMLARWLPETRAFSRVALAKAVSREDGYTAAAEDRGLIGARGAADTDLRPGGIAAIGGRRGDVVSRGEFIARGTPIVVADVHGSRIVVDRAGAMDPGGGNNPAV